MRKQEYLNKIRALLDANDVKDVDEIVYDISDLIEQKIKTGKSEENVILELGTPNHVVKEYITLGGEETEKQTETKPKKKLSKEVSAIMVCIFSILTAIFLATAIVFYFDVFNIVGENKMFLDFYQDTTQTTVDEFATTITICIKNESDIDYDDITIHISCVDKNQETVGSAYSEEKTTDIKAHDTVYLTFINPGWNASPDYEFLALKKVKKYTGTWEYLKTDIEINDFKNNSEHNSNLRKWFIFGSLAYALATLAIDIVFIVKLTKSREED